MQSGNQFNQATNSVNVNVNVESELIELKDHYLRSTCMIAVKVMMMMNLQSQSGHMSILKVKSQVKQQVGGKSMDGVFR